MKKTQNAGFVCANCGKAVLPLTKGKGGYRNHCPFCLCSLHADIEPGDRACGCLGIMRPAYVKYNAHKGWQIAQTCEKCGFTRLNVLTDDERQPDDMNIVYEIMRTESLYGLA